MIKRTFDIVVSGCALVLFSPLLIVTALLVGRDMGRPVLFIQQRPGWHEKPFSLIKFRTMKDATGPDGKPLPDDQRLTRLGLFLRAASIDELPELWNVLIGEMSLVGPRPLLMEYLPHYNDEQRRRCEMRPGITGWAQINGRNAISWEEKFALDVWYVDNQSLWLDIKILWLTAKKVIMREGISADGEATMPKFTGTKPTAQK